MTHCLISFHQSAYQLPTAIQTPVVVHAFPMASPHPSPVAKLVLAEVHDE
ncbi:MAG: hypothetical protein H6999_03495 [Hahellaceae bacterium]|nr:hypothetical protein [Hahellaceae bacterium]MCP5168802.1 hypothetical protein [Hahellaceae bacterium]